MDTAWITVTGVLGASLLTGTVTLAGLSLQARRERTTQRQEAGRRACALLLTYSGLIPMKAHALHTTMQHRSGVGEGLDVMMRLRRPVDIFEVHAQMRPDLEPIHSAWADVWLTGSQDIIQAANRVVDSCGDVIGTATRLGKARGRVASTLLGQKWTDEQIDEWQQAVRRLARARRDFALLVRRELGVEVAEVFAESPSLD